MQVNLVGVIGAGTMGAGIAQVAAQSGLQVVLRDVEQRFVDKGISIIKSNLERSVSKGKLAAEEATAILGRIQGTVAIESLKDCDLIIEAIIENMEVKRSLYKELDEVCKAETILASNTSGLSITEIGAATKRPQLVAGMHFFNPVPAMKLVEVIRGAGTTEEVSETIFAVARKMGKEPIAIKESPLFAVNRILVPMINEAVCVLAEGVACAEDIDKGMCLGANHPLGPLALADLIGLDTLLFVMDTLYKETQDSKYRSSTLLRQKVRAGHLGRKTGRGFYIY